MKSIQPVSSVLCDGLHRSPNNHTELENAAQKKPKTQSDSNVLAVFMCVAHFRGVPIGFCYIVPQPPHFHSLIPFVFAFIDHAGDTLFHQRVLSSPCRTKQCRPRRANQVFFPELFDCIGVACCRTKSRFQMTYHIAVLARTQHVKNTTNYHLQVMLDFVQNFLFSLDAVQNHRTSMFERSGKMGRTF